MSHPFDVDVSSAYWGAATPRPVEEDTDRGAAETGGAKLDADPSILQHHWADWPEEDTVSNQDKSDYQEWQAERDATLSGYDRDVRSGRAYRIVKHNAETWEATGGWADDTSFAAPADAHPTSAKFYAVLAEAAAMHAKKQADYGTDEDPFANVRASESFNVPAYLGCAIRMNDKMRRLMAHATKGSLANESLEDTFLDLLVYAGIGLVLVREQQT